MDVEKRTSKGGFLQLFDWNVKSRKKLFSNKSELPDGSKQGNEIVANSMILHPQLMEVCENGPGPRGKRNSDFNFPSSVTTDEGYGSRVPGVVAKLMGLDSLPTKTSSEPYSTTFCDSPFVKNSCSKRSICNFGIEHDIQNNNPNDGISGNLVEPRAQKVHSRPIERFQTETLPPKSAKSIPITHHRMLSPIKSPGFIPTNNVEYIMEAAAKIIEQGPLSTSKGKMPGVGSSSVPLKIRDLKQKMESAQRASGPPEASRRPKETISFKYSKGPQSERNHCGSGDTRNNTTAGSLKDSPESLNNKGKSVSLAVQARVNVQRRGGLTSSGNRSSINRKEGDVVKLGQFNKSETNMQKSVQKRTAMSRTSDVLKQNNQKQNCVVNKDRVASKVSVSNQQDRKAISINGSVRANKTSNKVLNSGTGTRKMNSVAKDAGKEHLLSKRETSSEKKQPVHRIIHFEESVAKNISISNDERSVKCNIANDGCLNWDAVDRKNSMDVVSFTFTSPIKKRSAPGSQSSVQVMKKNTSMCVDSCEDGDPHDFKSPPLSSQGLNVIGGDALSVLLEQKLKELTCRVELSNCNLVEGGAAYSTFSLQDSPSTLNVINTTSMEHHNSFQINLNKDKQSPPYDIDCASVNCLPLKAKQKWQRLEEMEGQSSSGNNSEYGKKHDCRYYSPISSSDGSYGSSDSKTSSTTNGCSRCLLAEAHGMVDCISARKCLSLEVETEFTDSASSTSAACSGGKDSSATFSSIDFKKSSNWELEYIANILGNSELILEDFVLGQVNNVISPNLFEQLENPKIECDDNDEEYLKLGRKVLFDCVCEFLELRCKHMFGRSSKAWSKWEALFQRRGWLTDEMYKEISGLTSVGDLMVDELVDKDMSSGLGKWVDFEIEVFEEGEDIEKEILTSLVDELVADFLLI